MNKLKVLSYEPHMSVLIGNAIESELSLHSFGW